MDEFNSWHDAAERHCQIHRADAKRNSGWRSMFQGLAFLVPQVVHDGAPVMSFTRLLWSNRSKMDWAVREAETEAWVRSRRVANRHSAEHIPEDAIERERERPIPT